MIKSKKIAAVLLAFLMLTSVAACGKKDINDETSPVTDTDRITESGTNGSEDESGTDHNGTNNDNESGNETEDDSYTEAETEEPGVDAMEEIEGNLSQYRLDKVQHISSDGYIGIPVEISIYYSGNTTVKEGYNGTPIILYAVNTRMDRVGTDSDVEIISSMLERGYVVVIADYLNDKKAVSPALDWSTQGMRGRLVAGEFFKSVKYLKSTGKYYETFVVPAGHNVSLGHVFWEFDKHSADGTLDKIVETWNNDFRYVKGDVIVKWTDEQGERKSVQNGFDGTAPVWLDSSGRANEDGEYIKIKHTKANDISDCSKIDGSPIDLNLYMHIIYPTSPESSVPVMCLASSAEHLAKGASTSDRPQLNGCAFGGYAAVMYDFGYTPMARDDHYSLFNGDLTGDSQSYMVHFFNDKKINTAAMRYVRYLSLSDQKYNFDTEAIGVIGNSKGGWMVYLGEEHPELLPERRIVPGYNGKSRFENGDTVSVGIIDGGEEQPWLTFAGETIDSGADFIYASCGGAEEYITEGHAPTYISCNKGDVSFYTSSNSYVNLCKTHNVPAIWFENDKGHTFAWGKDVNYGIDTYNAFIDFANFYLRGDSVKILYTDLTDGGKDIPTTKEIFFLFSGAVDESEIVKLTPKDGEGNAAAGKWISEFGGTHWTFKPYGMKGGEMYTVTVPEDFSGVNGAEIGKSAKMRFETAAEKTSSANTVSGSRGTYAYFTNTEEDSHTLRFTVEEDGYGVIELYALSGFDPKAPDSAEQGSLIGTYAVTGRGTVEFDVTEYCRSIAVGDTVAFLIKEAREIGKTTVFEADFNNGDLAGVGFAQTYTVGSAPDGESAIIINKSKLNGGFLNTSMYINQATVATKNNILNVALNKSDIGRRYTIKIKVYDTASRYILAYLDSATSSQSGVVDYNWCARNVKTVAGEWTEITLEYTVTDPMNAAPSLVIKADFFGEDEHPLYIGSIACVETVDKLSIGSMSVVTCNDDMPDKEDQGATVEIIRSGSSAGKYRSLEEAISKLKTGDKIRLLASCTLESELNKIDEIALNGYKLYIAASLSSDVKLSGGYVYIEDVPLISEGGKYEFEDVTFVLGFNAESEYFAADPMTDGNIEAEFTNCVFNISEWRAVGNMTVFPAGETADISYRINGGELRFSSLSKLTVNESIFALEMRELDGKYPSMVLPQGLKMPEITFRMGDKAGVYKDGVNDGEYTVYSLTEDALSSIYGTVPDEYSDVEKYPFAVFDNKGQFVMASDNFAANSASGALSSLAQQKEGTFYILLRRDFVYEEAVFGNLSFIYGRVTIDLGGYTFSCNESHDKGLFYADAKRSADTEIIVKNGRMLVGKNPIVIFGGWGASGYKYMEKVKNFSFVFENITFGLLEGATATRLVSGYKGGSDAPVNAFVTLNECVFDLSTVKPRSIVLFTAGDDTGNVKGSVTVIGGYIIVDEPKRVTVQSVMNRESEVMFRMGEEGYIILSAPKGMAVTKDTFVTNLGDACFVEFDEIDGYTLYQLEIQ